MKILKKQKAIFVRNVILLAVTAVVTLLYINRTGAYPWGSDTYGHLFRGNILSDSIRNGNIFINYNESWYNGIQPYRYWAPFAYYILALINLLTGNIIITFNIFIFFIFMLGGLGWLSWGYYTGRQNLGLLLAVMWFFVPNNLRVLFSEGNIPYVTVNNLIPFIFLYYYKSVKEDKILNYITLSLFMFTVTLTHAMLAAMTGLILFLLAAGDCIINRRWKKNAAALIYAFCGVMLAGFWLYPALKGGLLSLDKGAQADFVSNLAFPLKISLNPLLRFTERETYYFGLAFAFTAVFGILFSKQKDKAPYITAIIVLIGTTKAVVPLLQKLPMNQLFWVYRATSISSALVMFGLILWFKLKKRVLYLLLSLLIIDSACSFYVLGYNGQFPSDLAGTIDAAENAAAQRIGVMDDSTYGSFPTYYIGYNSAKGVTNQVFGWSWQGAATSKNIVMLNTALENGYYGFMFDRALELGADTLIVKKSLIKSISELQNCASKAGYVRQSENDSAVIYKYPVPEQFGTSVDYEGIAIGTFAPNIVYLFPKFHVGDDIYLDDYSYEDLKYNKAIFLSGFKYKSRQKAENLVLRLSRGGVKVVIDAEGLEESFLNVLPQPVTINKNYGEMYYNGVKLSMDDFPEELGTWKTKFLRGAEDNNSFDILDHRILNYIGKKDNENLCFMGLNIPYYAFITKNHDAVNIMEQALGMKAYELADRKVHKITIERRGNDMQITSDAPNVIVPVAALDAFLTREGNFTVVDNLIFIKTSRLSIEIVYPYLVEGSVVSLISLLAIIALSLAAGKKRFIFLGETMKVTERTKEAE